MKATTRKAKKRESNARLIISNEVDSILGRPDILFHKTTVSSERQVWNLSWASAPVSSTSASFKMIAMAFPRQWSVSYDGLYPK